VTSTEISARADSHRAVLRRNTPSVCLFQS